MTALFNILWIIFGGGFVIWIEYLLAGALLCLTIVGIPFGLQCFKIAGLGLLPFGKDIEEVKRGIASGTVGTLLNIVWLVCAGIWIFISHVVLCAGLAISIIGIPFAIQHFKLGVLALAPFGRRAR